MRSPYDQALALCPTDTAKLELARIGAELQLGAESQEWIVLVLYAEARRLFGPSTVSGDDSQTVKLGPLATRLETAMVTQPAVMPRSTARPRSRPLKILGLLALLMLVGVTAWIGGASVATAQTHFHSARVATMMTTPAGAAAWNLLTANGADLPQNLARCTHINIYGRSAQHCILWRTGPAPAPTRNPLWAFQNALATLPSWPFAVTSIAALCVVIALAITTRQGSRVRRI